MGAEEGWVEHSTTMCANSGGKEQQKTRHELSHSLVSVLCLIRGQHAFRRLQTPALFLWASGMLCIPTYTVHQSDCHRSGATCEAFTQSSPGQLHRPSRCTVPCSTTLLSRCRSIQLIRLVYAHAGFYPCTRQPRHCSFTPTYHACCWHSPKQRCRYIPRSDRTGTPFRRRLLGHACARPYAPPRAQRACRKTTPRTTT
jgi:hypothetical protein